MLRTLLALFLLAAPAFADTPPPVINTDCPTGPQQFVKTIHGKTVTCGSPPAVTGANFTVGAGLSILSGTGTASVLNAFSVGIAAGYYLPTTGDQTSWNAKQAAITTGTTSQYFKGDLSLGTFQTDVRAQFSGTAPIAISSGAISCAAASASVVGCVQTADFISWTAKQAALGYTPLNPANNLSEVTPSTARTNLGLGSIATFASSAYAAVANNLSDLANAATARTNLGLGTIATAASGAYAAVANNLSDLANAATARTNLGLGTAATQANSFFAQVANNLSDLANAGTARTNLGLGTIATHAASEFAVLLGLAGGQQLDGGTASGENLTLMSTAHATKGLIKFGASAYDEVNNRLGINTTTMTKDLTVRSNASSNSTVSIGLQYGASGIYEFYLTASTAQTLTIGKTGYHGILTLDQVGLASWARGNESGVTATNTFGHSYDESSSNPLMVLWGTGSGNTGDLWRVYSLSTGSGVLSEKIETNGRHTINQLVIPPQGSGVTPSSPISGQVAFTSAYILCVYNGSAWKQVSDGSTGCTF